MSDYSQFKKLFDDQGISYASESVTGNEARELARVCAEPLAAKTSRYIMVGSTYFHFDFTGRFIGIESQTFECRLPRIDKSDSNVVESKDDKFKKG